jgi:hypothetical protein
MTTLGIKEAIMMLTLRHPDWSTAEIRSELVALGFDRPTSFMVSSIKRTFRDNVRFLVKEGVIDPDPQPNGPPHSDLIRKRPKKRRRPDPPSGASSLVDTSQQQDRR